MRLFSIGLSHTTASIDLRERLAFDEDQIRASLSRLTCGGQPGPISELVILSTCNRVEMYAVSNQEIFPELETFLSSARDVPRGELTSHLYRYRDMDVVRHLFEVSAGLDSLVIGEPQILGQVTRALELARGQAAAGSILNRLFQAAIHAGKRARTETTISRNPTSVSSLAASVAGRTVGHIQTASVVVLGAGEMAELTVEALRKRGVDRLCVVNRTLERARELADKWGAESTTFEFLQDALGKADILISSTGAPHTLVTVGMVRQAMQVRPQRPLVLIDIAVPRDIDPDAAAVPQVKLFDMDTLNAQLEDSLVGRMNETPHVREILAEETLAFEVFLNSLRILPIISDIHQYAESIRAAELQKTLRRLPNLTDVERERIDALTQALVRKLFDEPTRRLRSESTFSHAPEYATVVRTLFGLQETGHDSLSGGPHPGSLATD